MMCVVQLFSGLNSIWNLDAFEARQFMFSLAFFEILQEEDVNGKIRTYEKKIGSLMTEVGSLKNEVGNTEIIILNS